MTDARDELALLIGRCVDRHLPGIPMGPVQSFMVATADAILAAGWRAPLPNRWTCGHERRPGNWGINGECIQCAMKDGLNHDHVWDQDITSTQRHCAVCGVRQPLDDLDG